MTKLVHLFKDDPRNVSLLSKGGRVALCDAVIRKEVDVAVWEASWEWCKACQRIQNFKAGVAR